MAFPCFLIYTTNNNSGEEDAGASWKEEDDDDVEVCDVEEATEEVERDIEEMSAAKDTPLDEDEAAALELVDEIGEWTENIDGRHISSSSCQIFTAISTSLTPIFQRKLEY